MELLEKVAEQPIRNQIMRRRSPARCSNRMASGSRLPDVWPVQRSQEVEAPDQGIATAMAKIRIGRGWGLNETGR